MSRRRQARFPILSMLDLLFGTFGALIVVSVMLTFLRLQESRINQRPMYFVGVAVAAVGAPANLDSLFIEFELDAGNRRTLLSPLTADASDPPAGPAEAQYRAAASGSGPSASLLLPEPLVRSARDVSADAKVSARLQNLPALLYDGDLDAAGPAELRMSVIIPTARFGCAAEREVSLSALFNAETRNAGDVSIFRLLIPGEAGVVCSGEDGIEIPNDVFEVADGALRIPLD